MARKVKHEEHENHERWLVSYADFITLLFAFFTVLYASAQTDQKKLSAIINAMNAAFDGGMPNALLDVLDVDPPPPDVPNIVPNHLTQEAAEPTIVTLKRNLEGSLSDNVVQIGMVDQDLVLVLPQSFLFVLGRAELRPSAYGVLSEIAEKLARSAVSLVEVTGHADGVPLGPGGLFADNWALAAERSLVTVRYLARHGLPAARLTSSATLADGENAEARSVTMKVRVSEPGPAAEVADGLVGDGDAEDAPTSPNDAAGAVPGAKGAAGGN